MKLHTFLFISLSIGLAACAEKEQVTAPAEDPAAAVTEAAATEVAAAPKDELGTSDFIEHMHHHASQLGQLNAALEVGSLAAAQRPAYWLAGHEEIDGVPADWLVYVNGMRDAASAVDSARDISEARAAAEQIESNCRGCHTSAGVEVASLQVE